MEQTADRPYAIQIGARVRIFRRGRSRPFTRSELAKACTMSPATLTRSPREDTRSLSEDSFLETKPATQ